MRGRGQGVARISTHSALKPFISNELSLAIENPIRFVRAASRSSRPTSGYEATILHDLCEMVLNARDAGALKTEQEERYAASCGGTEIVYEGEYYAYNRDYEDFTHAELLSREQILNG